LTDAIIPSLRYLVERAEKSDPETANIRLNFYSLLHAVPVSKAQHHLHEALEDTKLAKDAANVIQQEAMVVVADATPACQKTIGAAHEITSGLPVIRPRPESGWVFLKVLPRT
jgi:hypothetical protein